MSSTESKNLGRDLLDQLDKAIGNLRSTIYFCPSHGAPLYQQLDFIHQLNGGYSDIYASRTHIRRYIIDESNERERLETQLKEVQEELEKLKMEQSVPK